MTIIDALLQSIATSIEDAKTYINGLATIRQTGKGAELWTDFWRIFLAEEKKKRLCLFSKSHRSIR